MAKARSELVKCDANARKEIVLQSLLPKLNDACRYVTTIRAGEPCHLGEANYERQRPAGSPRRNINFILVCTTAAVCVAPEASPRPTMDGVVQSLKMVQRVTEYQDSMLTISINRPN
ncbi:hypothetical protein SCA6_003247 [Theobroma cacao]